MNALLITHFIKEECAGNRRLDAIQSIRLSLVVFVAYCLSFC